MSLPAPKWLYSWPHVRVYALPALLVLAIGLFRLFGGEYKVDTGLYAGVGLHMFREGTWWTPMAGDLPYFNKPPLVLWIHGFFLEVFGVSMWSIRLPQIIAAMGCAALTAGIARALSGPRVALVAGLIFATSYPVWIHLNRLVLDYWLLLFMLTGVWMCMVGALKRREAWIIAAGVPIGLAMLCKPLFPLLALPILALWMVLAGHRSKAAWVGVAAGMALLVSLPWHLGMTALHKDLFLDQYFGREVFDRGAGAGGFRADPWWEYLAMIAIRFLPWCIPLGAAVWVITVKLVRSRGRCMFEESAHAALGKGADLVHHAPASDAHESMSTKRADFFTPGPDEAPLVSSRGGTPARRMTREWQGILLCVLWAGIWLVLLSAFFADKRDRYMLHVWPMLSWLAAMWIVHWAAPRIRGFDSKWLGRGVAAMLALGVVGAATGLPPQAPVQTKWRQLDRWLERQRLEGYAPEVWSGSLAPFEEGQVYLDTGIWPKAIWHGGSNSPRLPPEDAIVIFERDRLQNLARAAGLTPEPIFESGPDRNPIYGDARALVAIRWTAAWNAGLASASRAEVGIRP